MVKTQPLVLLKGQKNGITIQLDGSAGFDPIRDELRKKVADARDFFAGANTNVTFKGRALTEDEEKSLLDVIFSETTLDVSFVASENFNLGGAGNVIPLPVVQQAERVPVADAPTEDALAAGALVNILPDKNVPQMEYNTLYYRHNLRSGQAISFDGSVVVLGDANAGSEVVAKGNIIVLGALRGMVHAGSGGDTSCFVSALTLTPTQLRIAGIITSIQQEKPKKHSIKERYPEYAYIQDGQVYVVRH